ncbi:MAG: DUF4290 domain-containing protein [Chitinophagaceae bacterium]|nr:DUF4290 domain-containing protein [Chitinophagaceae bacterium]
MEYNTTRELMPIKEYGRSVHNMVKHLMTIEDPEARQRNAEAVVEVMAILSPQTKSIEDYKQKLWDHLFLISDYKLDVKSPYPIPTQALKQRKPDPLHYPKQKIKWNHFGVTFEKLYTKAIAETDEEKKTGYIQVLALFMKVAYNNWHKENVHDDMIRDELSQMSKGALIWDPTLRFKDFVDIGDGTIIHASQKVAKPYGNNNRYGRNNNNNRMNSNPNPNRNNNKFVRFKKKNNPI